MALSLCLFLFVLLIFHIVRNAVRIQIKSYVCQFPNIPCPDASWKLTLVFVALPLTDSGYHNFASLPLLTFQIFPHQSLIFSPLFGLLEHWSQPNLSEAHCSGTALIYPYSGIGAP